MTKNVNVSLFCVLVFLVFLHHDLSCTNSYIGAKADKNAIKLIDQAGSKFVKEGLKMNRDTFKKFKQDGEVPCNQLKNCKSCAAIENCGWCEDTQKCYNATSNGEPIDKSCEIFYYEDCVDADMCEDLEVCNHCLENPSCGWCDEYICLVGNENGPSANETRCHEWIYGNPSNVCNKPVNCSIYNDCASCSKIDKCGWCNNMMNGSIGCYNSDNNTFSLSSLICMQWDNGTCKNESLTVDCDKNKNCTSCVSDISESCAWCNDNSKCILNINDNISSCSNINQKECKASCYDHSSSCESCTKLPECIWCDNSCVEGDDTGPSYADCTIWKYDNCKFENCTSHKDCKTCNGVEGCEWCNSPDGSTCKSLYDLCKGQWVHDCDASTCYQQSTCSSCIDLPNCNWCGSDGCRDISSSPSQYVCTRSCSSQPNTNNDDDDDDGSGGVLGGGILETIVLSIVGAAAAIILIASVIAFYKFYWIKRHYYERLG